MASKSIHNRRGKGASGYANFQIKAIPRKPPGAARRIETEGLSPAINWRQMDRIFPPYLQSEAILWQNGANQRNSGQGDSPPIFSAFSLVTIMPRSIKRDFQYLSVSTIIISMVFLGGFWMIYDYRMLQVESAHLRAKHMTEYQDVLRSQVDRVIGDIELEKSLQEQQLIVFLKERTNEAFAIAENLVAQNNKAIDKASLEKLVKDSLRNIRFNDGRGYFFAVNMNGTEELFPTYPELEGRDLSSLQNSEGKFVVAEMLALARTASEGFIRYTWNKPDKHEKKYPKIAYIKYVPALDWIIGTGEYLDDATAKLQENIVQQEVLGTGYLIPLEKTSSQAGVISPSVPVLATIGAVFSSMKPSPSPLLWVSPLPSPA
jgi:hypothetical protein